VAGRSQGIPNRFRAGGRAFEAGLNFRVADSSRFVEGSEGSVFSEGSQTTDPSKNQRVGHPEEPNQLLSLDVLEWYYSIVGIRQEENARGFATRHPTQNQSLLTLR
jgi:hypothetical protein